MAFQTRGLGRCRNSTSHVQRIGISKLHALDRTDSSMLYQQRQAPPHYRKRGSECATRGTCCVYVRRNRTYRRAIGKTFVLVQVRVRHESSDVGLSLPHLFANQLACLLPPPGCRRRNTLVTIPTKSSRLFRKARQYIRRPSIHIRDGRSTLGWPIGHSNHFTRSITSVWSIGMKKREVDDDCSTRRCRNTALIRVGRIPLVRIGIRMHREV